MSGTPLPPVRYEAIRDHLLLEQYGRKGALRHREEMPQTGRFATELLIFLSAAPKAHPVWQTS